MSEEADALGRLRRLSRRLRLLLGLRQSRADIDRDFAGRLLRCCASRPRTLTIASNGGAHVIEVALLSHLVGGFAVAAAIP